MTLSETAIKEFEGIGESKMTKKIIIDYFEKMIRCEVELRSFCELHDCSECEYYTSSFERVNALKNALGELKKSI